MKTAGACISFDVVTLAERRGQLVQLLAEAGRQGVELLVLPEFCFTQRTREAIHAQDSGAGFHCFAETLPGGPGFALMAEAARKHRMTIVYGGFERKNRRHMYNTAVVIGPQGRMIGKHRKAILAPAEGEDFNGETLPGQTLELVRTPAGKAGIITCYEMNFPEVARVYELKGADFLIYPHADNDLAMREVATVRSRDAFMPLICGCYASAGGAYILDANGKTMAQTEGAGLAVADVDLAAQPRGKYRWNGDEFVNLRKMRWYQRRPELFGVIAGKKKIPHPLASCAAKRFVN